MKIVIAGGGTGGHVFPALAVARELKSTIAGARIFFIGTARGLEARVVPREGYDISFIRSEGLVGKSPFRTMRALFKVPLSLLDARRMLREIKPDLVLGVGGYSSGPVLLSARLMGIPSIIHEQNTIPGLTNRMLGKLVDTVAVTYHESIKFFPPDRTYLTGNPVRTEILHGDRERGYRTFSLHRDRITICVFGGSLGAHSINSAVGEALDGLEPMKEKIQFLHQTGEKDCTAVKEVYRARGFMGTVIPFAHEMADAYAVADLIISRAGATTLAELTACGKAAILVPYPYAGGNHQEINARKLWDMGAAQMILDRELEGRTLASAITRLLEEPEAIAEMEGISKSLGSREAGKKVVNLMMGLLKKKDSRIRLIKESSETEDKKIAFLSQSPDPRSGTRNREQWSL
ncbi:MAG: undecaprenyldiphospho-muramoylpentapeptide beta-N-acetylglucosaminyltransferase [Nitrospiraceae bacterium]|nr:MAG: undecaprenyldiphospho-muramoylpentapeptide beta-N-acetylglucosaminyltransferase [Nitrospiraceae bacterium]